LEAAKFDLVGFPVTIFLNQIARFAVPLFILISGFVLETSFNPNLGYISFLKKRFSKIFIPYVFWSVIYYFLVYNQNHDNFLRVILTGDASYQLYFIPTLCIFYLIFPFLHKIYKIISNKWFLILLFLSQVWLLYKDYFVKEFKFDDPIHIAILAYFFFIIGIVAARNKDAINEFVHKWKYYLLSRPIVTALYVFWEGRDRFLATGNYLSYYSQWRPSTLIYTILVGLVSFHLFEKAKLQFSVLEKLSRLSFLVFFVHVAVLEVTWSLVGKNLFSLLNPNLFGKIAFDFAFFGVIATISFLLAYLLHKIPGLYRLIG
jgi:surface polysaccharide O-acyltransferase-like enzyme